MHFEVPKSKTLKEFGGEYLMIVISILTALALEAAVEKVHHDHVAHEAREQMDIELRADLKSVERVLAHNDEKWHALRAVRDEMLAALRAHVTDEAFMEQYERVWRKALDMSLQGPSLRREAWEAAVASQAVTWMPRATLERYATIYAQMRDKDALFNGGAMNFLDAPRMQDVFSDVQTGHGNPRDMFKVVTQMAAAYDSFDGNLKSLKDDLASTVGEHGHG